MIKVGHHVAALTKERTLGSLYIDPLTKILDAQNPEPLTATEDTRPQSVNVVSSEMAC